MQGAGISAKLIKVKTSYEVRAGDIVYADKNKNPGKLGGPIIAGIVTSCQTDKTEPWFWEICVKPACDFSNLRDVAVIIMNPKTQAD